MLYSDSTPLRDARAQYFRENGFGEDGGYGRRLVRLKLGPVLLWFPNTRGRVRAVRLHDLHHIATGYTTTPVGEAEIGPRELASGCGDYLAAWVLNLGAVAIGLLVAPARARAGRRQRSATHRDGTSITKVTCLTCRASSLLLTSSHENLDRIRDRRAGKSLRL